LDTVLLWSPGGSVEEAFKIGHLIRKGLLDTWAPFNTEMVNGWGHLSSYSDSKTICRGIDCNCASACFLIWAAGVDRSGDALGLHRPTIESTQFASLPPDRASVLYRELLADIGKYLTDMEVPPRFIEAMTGTSSADMWWLSAADASSMEDVPSINEWLVAACGVVRKLGPKAGAFDKFVREETQRCQREKIYKARDAIRAID
jgi:hypothetical protein